MKNDNYLNLGINTADTFTAANGSTSDYQSIFEGILKNVSIFAGHSKMSREDLQDLAQDAFLKAIQYHGSFDPGKCSKPQDFGNRIAQNCIVDALHRMERHDAAFSDLEVYDKDGDEKVPYRISGYRGDEFEADRALEQAEVEERVSAAIETLNKGYQDILWLSLQGYKTGEIAEQLGLDADIAYTRLCRAKAALRKALGTDLEDYLDFGD